MNQKKRKQFKVLVLFDYIAKQLFTKVLTIEIISF
jgi:hypothetical protein